MYTQEQVSRFLIGLNAPHLREEMTRPTLTYHVTYSESVLSETDYVGGDADFRVDGRIEDRNPSAPLNLATIGSNGRDTITGQVLFIGVDLDSNANHAVGLDAVTLEYWIEKLSALPYVHIIRSRSGNGIHLYIFIGREIFAASNSDVIAIARALKVRIADDLGDERFLDAVDCAGSILYFHSPNPGERGFEVVKRATELFTGDLEPLYSLGGEATHNVQDVTELDDEHSKLVDWLLANALKDFTQVTSTLFHAHTSDLKRAHEALNLKGKFDTAASGSGDAKRNCWMRAQAGGKWLVGNWGSDNETSWKLSNRIGRYTILNQATSLTEFASANNIIRRGVFLIFTKDQITAFCAEQGVVLPETTASYFSVRYEPGQILIEVDAKPSETLSEGWIRVSSKRACLAIPVDETERPDPASLVRIAYSPEGKGFDPHRRVHGTHWQPTTPNDAANRLTVAGYSKFETIEILTPDRPLRVVNKPFQGEFPAPFEWNRGATQLAFKPATEDGPYKHWQMILDHCGAAFDEAVSHHPWCQEFGIHTGADYLKVWAARMLRYPEQRSPGLGLFGPQNCGKTSLNWSHGKLMTGNGYLNSPRALTTDFNSQLMGVVLWDFDDVDLAARSGELYSKLQPLMTGDTFGLVGKGTNETTVANTLHFTHTANRLEFFTVQPGDTRWVLGEVKPLANEIPQGEFTRALLKEAPYYLKALFDLPMPSEAAGRLFLPVLDTPLKTTLMAQRLVLALNQEQQQWLLCIKELALRGRLSEFTTFHQLKDLMGQYAPPTPEALNVVWTTLADKLQSEGFRVSHRRSNNSRYPAAWMVQAA